MLVSKQGQPEPHVQSKAMVLRPYNCKMVYSILFKYKLKNLTVVNIFPSLSTAKYFFASSPQTAMRSGPTERNCKTAEMQKWV